MKPNLRSGMLAAAAMAGLVLAGCEANGGPQPGGGGDGTGAAFDHCTFPFGPASSAEFGFQNCLNCSGANGGNAIDSDTTNFATLNVTTLGPGLAVFYVGLDPTYAPNPSGPTFPAGNIAGFVLGFPGIVDATVIPGFSIQTKLDDQTQEKFDFNGIVGAELLGAVPAGAPIFIGVPTTKEFDAVEFEVTPTLANVLNEVDIYAACANGDASTTLPYILL